MKSNIESMIIVWKNKGDSLIAAENIVKIGQRGLSMDLLTMADIARRLEIPESTCRYYRDRFIDYIPFVGDGRQKRYKPETLEILRTIAEGLRNNLTAVQVEGQLSRLYNKNIDNAEEQQQSLATVQQQPIIAQENINLALQQVAAVMEQLVNQTNEVKELRGEIQRLRDEQQKQASIIEQLEKKRPWWKFWE